MNIIQLYPPTPEGHALSERLHAEYEARQAGERKAELLVQIDELEDAAAAIDAGRVLLPILTDARSDSCVRAFSDQALALSTAISEFARNLRDTLEDL